MAIMRIIEKNYEIDVDTMMITAGLGVIFNIIMGTLLYFGSKMFKISHSHSHGGAINQGHAHLHTTAKIDVNFLYLLLKIFSFDNLI